MATFEDVYRQHLPAVLRAAARVAGRRDVAEEIAADAFLELYRQFDRIDVDRLPGWLLTVVRNRAIDYWRRQQTERLLAQEAAPVSSADPAPVAEHANLFAHPALKPIHRVCLVLRYQHGLTREEIARRLGLTDTQVRGHLQYALTLLRKSLVVQTG
jgi:RNA polymerase sigma-70 factor (ECF subfamily)